MATGTDVSIAFSTYIPAQPIANTPFSATGTRVGPRKLVVGTVGTGTTTTGNTVVGSAGNDFYSTQLGLTSIDGIVFTDQTIASTTTNWTETTLGRRFVVYNSSANKLWFLRTYTLSQETATNVTVTPIASTAGTSFTFVAYGPGIDGLSTNTPV